MKNRSIITATVAAGVVFGVFASRFFAEPAKDGVARSVDRAVAGVASGPGYHALKHVLLKQDRVRRRVAVSKIVNQRNQESAQQIRAFEEDGWKMVVVPPPDPQITGLDPAVLGTRENEIQVQLSSNSYAGPLLEKVREIALKTQSEKTRYLAIDSLGRSPDVHSQELLIQVYQNPAIQSDDRKQILGYMRPSRSDDSVADFLVAQIADPRVPESMKRQAAFPLIAMSMTKPGSASQATPDEDVLRRIPSGWREDFVKLHAVVARGALAASAH